MGALDVLNKSAPVQTARLMPDIVPVLAGAIWDTKADVKKAARESLTKATALVSNKDIERFIPVLIKALINPVEEVPATIALLSATTFVSEVDSPTLSLMVPLHQGREHYRRPSAVSALLMASPIAGGRVSVFEHVCVPTVWATALFLGFPAHFILVLFISFIFMYISLDTACSSTVECIIKNLAQMDSGKPKKLSSNGRMARCRINDCDCDSSANGKVTVIL